MRLSTDLCYDWGYPSNLSDRYSMSRTDDLGYMMLHEAIRMGESLGLVGNTGPRITSEQLSEEMDSSCRRTAWGLFSVDT